MFVAGREFNTPAPHGGSSAALGHEQMTRRDVLRLLEALGLNAEVALELYSKPHHIETTDLSRNVQEQCPEKSVTLFWEWLGISGSPVGAVANRKDDHPARAVSATLLIVKPQAAEPQTLVYWYSDYLPRTVGLFLRRVVFSPYRACCCAVNHVYTDYDAHVLTFHAVVFFRQVTVGVRKCPSPPATGEEVQPSTSKSSDDPNPCDPERNTSSENSDSDYKFSQEPQPFNQKELVKDLKLPKEASEILASRLKEKNLLTPERNIPVFYRTRENNLCYRFFLKRRI
ncbi:uncharacterized protein TNCV_2183801 [Trichonephila clavipes]|nr:uncharacterized protein TNCV_2183801 [Trichonephila clavipes]